ncbi:DNA-binding transcriptional regulator, IclR family [Prauserella marina]|uniref:DNA-binding transcriptional regulator, IclR family n=1 Tax=Prauserella marina TaxID=530584 RepID=A0A1G6UI24_9PSEU|nr:IclR family transcriptional regulator C-terminal domain-containing protein [Prauserella marina]PWV74775.1 IclR family transcriptional regulator [Prauserella marina]SDD41012.1 DNA-binding transcriptional regulator, IclR family [Prauserella marina]
MGEAPTLIGSVQRALHLLDLVGASERPVPAKTLARTLGLRLPTVYHLLRTLVYEGYLDKIEEGYVIGDRVDALGRRSITQAAVVRGRATLSALRDELGSAAYFALYREGEIELVDVADGPRMRRVDLWVGTQETGHATAFGKSILSCLDKEGRDDYFSRYRPLDLTPHTLTDRRVLEEKLSRGAEISTDREEYLLGTACVAVPVQAPGVLGAVAISRPVHRHRGAAEAESLKRAAGRMSRALVLFG